MISPIARQAWAAGSDKPIKIGLQVHLTGIISTYGRWYERTSKAAVKVINESGGIGGRPIELIIEDDGTDPRRGAEAVGKLVNQHKVDFIFGCLAEWVMHGSWPTATELKMPYLLCGEASSLPAGKMSRYVFQPCMTDVRSQISAVGKWISELGKNVTMILPDYEFGYDHRDYFGEASKKYGSVIKELIMVPATETSYTKYFPKVPADTDLIYHVMVGPGILTFVREMGEYFGSNRPQLFGFIDSLEAVDIASPGLEFLEGSYFWEGLPRYAGKYQTSFEKFYRKNVGITDMGHSVGDERDIPTYSHMFGCWETLFAIKEVVELSGYKERTPRDVEAFITAFENIPGFEEGIGHPQGRKLMLGKAHQGIGQNFISKVENQKLNTIFKTEPEDGLNVPDADYTTQLL
jgi:branched-chain amino acid transport system substrate-binding protein